MSAVEFSVDQSKYRVLHQRGRRALFSSDGTLIVATGDHQIWSEHFSQITGFNLVFSDTEAESQQGDPSCFFLPFYINQDGSWHSSWATFQGMQRYRYPQGPILEYFSGIHPPEYYSVRAERDQKRKALKDLQKEQQFLNRARERIGKTLSLSGPKIQPDNFEREIDSLTKEVTELNNQQEELRSASVREQEMLANIKLQIVLATDALGAYDGDMKFLHEGREKLVCPTCRAEHPNSFLSYLTYAEDARVLRELIIRLQEDAQKIGLKYQNTQSKLADLESRYSRISEILEIRRGDLQFGQVVESLGAESAFKAFELESKTLKEEISVILYKLKSLDEKLNQLTGPKRTQSILKNFRDHYEAARRALHLLPVDTAALRLAGRPKSSGSAGPRSILAYYAALWHVCHGEYASFSVPVVIESPNQQAQDDVNLPIVLQFIAEGLHPDIQLIVGLETEPNYRFDNTTYLSDPYQVLTEDEFGETLGIIEPMEIAMFKELQTQIGSLFPL